MSASFERIQAAAGGDPPAAYTRALHEASAELNGSADPTFGPLGYRADAAKLIVVFGESTPHDNDLNEGVPGSTVPFLTGGDPGRNAIIDEPSNPANIGVSNDDLDWQQVLAALSRAGVRLVRYELSPFYGPLWEHWAQRTGGQSVTPLDDLATALRSGMLDRGPVAQVTLQAQDGFAAWLGVTPPAYTNVLLPAALPFALTVTPPPGTPPGGYTFQVNLVADSAVVATQQISITVEPPPNRAPVAANDAFTVTQDSAGNVLAVLANDFDPDNDTLTLAQVGAASHGVATRVGSTVVYTPTTGYTGPDSFTYVVSDGKTTAVATVNLTITPKPNRAPVAVNDAFTVTQDSAGSVLAVLANDFDPDNDALTLAQVGAAGHGVAASAGNSVIYTPTAGYSGPDSFTYAVSDGKTTAAATVNLTVTPRPNRAPVAANDAFTVTQDSAGSVLAVLANDFDPDNDVLTLAQVGAASHGVVTRVGSTVVYTPTAGYTGPDSFTYTVSDGKITAAATVSLTITPKPNRAPVAANDAFTVTQDSAGNVLAVLANDSDPDNDVLTLVQVGAAGHGVAASAGNSVIYTPTAGYTGPDSFTYAVSDGRTTAAATVNLTVTAKPNRAPVAANDAFTVTQDSAGNVLAVLANDFDPDNDVLTLAQVGAASHGVATRAGNSVIYTPTAGYTGPDSFTYVVSDGKTTAAATVNLTITPKPNRAPVAANDAFTVTQDSAGNVLAVLANDFDPDNDALTLAQVGAASHGVVTRAGNAVVYTPTAGYTGPDSFTYVVSDGKSTAAATASITVSPQANRAPVAANDAFTVTQDSAGNVLAVLANDSDPDNDALTLAQVGAASHGVAARAGNAVVYTPTSGYTGPDNFTYAVSDGKTTAAATASITVSPLPNRAPVAANDAFTVTQDSAGNVLAVLANDFDPDNDALTLAQVGAASHGVAARAGNAVVYTPTAGYTGPDSFTYAVSDGKNTAAATVNLTVTPKPNRAPVAANDAFTVTQNSTGNVLAVLANDFDPDNNALTLAQVGAASHGVVTHVGNAVVYTPTAGYSGPDSFTYTVSDGKTTTAATVNLTVTPRPNRAPVAANDAFTVTQDSAGNVLAVLANDFDPDNDVLTLAQVGAASHGVAARVGNAVVYTPTAGYTGPDSFTYAVSDGKTTAAATVSLTITPKPNRAPVAANDAFTVTQDSAGNVLAVLANDFDPDNDVLTLAQVGAASHGVAARAGNSVIYTPTTGYTGPDSFTYAVSDGKSSAAATVNLTIAAKPNRAPVAANDAFTVTRDSAGNVLAVLANDSDPDNDALTLAQVGTASHGVATRVGHVVVYTPTAGYSGPDSFTYAVSDGKATAAAIASITVSPRPQASFALQVVGERSGAFADGVVRVGELVTVTTHLTNTGAVTLTAPPLSQVADGVYLARIGAPAAGVTATLRPGEHARLRVVYRALAATSSLSDSVTLVRSTVDNVSDATGAPLPARTAHTAVRITAPGVSVSTQRAADVGPSLAAGDLVTFTVTLLNDGDTMLTVLPLQEEFPAAVLTFVRASAPGATVDPINGRVQWPDLAPALGALPPGASAQLDVTYALASIAAGAERTVSLTGVRDEFGDPVEPATAALPVVTPGLSLGIAATPAAGSQVQPGAVVTYMIQVANTGDTLLTGIAITSALTGEGVFLDDDATGLALLAPCAVAGSAPRAPAVRGWQIADLPAGTSCEVVARARVAINPEGGDLTLAATVQASELAEPNGAEASHAVFPVAPLVSSFTAITTPAGIRLDWATAWENELTGFHLWRGTTSVRDSAVRITAESLSARGAPGAYTYTDAVFQGGVYYYWLEPVGAWGSLEVGPAAARWAPLHLMLPLVVNQQLCAAACAPQAQLWLPMITRQ